MIFGTNSLAEILLAALEFDLAMIPRLRDAYVVADPDGSDDVRILIYTRTGGGNRAYYDSRNEDNPDGPWNSTLREHICYLKDEDDNFDSTYAKFYYRLPDVLVPHTDSLRLMLQSSPEDRWKAVMEMLPNVPKT